MDWFANAVYEGLYEVVLGVSAAIVDLIIQTIVSLFSGYLPGI